MKNISIALSLACLLLNSCAKVPKIETAIRPVMVEKAQFVTKGPSLIFSGFSKSEKFIDRSFRVSGQILELPVRIGEKLKPGQIIARLDDHDYILELEKAQAAQNEALADARKAFAQYRRIRSLYESESASRDELDTARAAHEASKASVEKTTANLELAELNLSYTVIRAETCCCEISSKDAEVHENVAPGETVVTLSCGTKLEVEVAVPETQISNIKEGESVTVEFNAISNQVFQGIVHEVGPSASGGTTFPVTIKLEDAHEKLRSGMAAKVIIYTELEEKEPVIMVPIQSVADDDSGSFVFLYEPSGDQLGEAIKQHVTVGPMRPNGFVILSGVSKGDLVITAGLRFLHNKQKVKLVRNDFKPFKERL